MLPLQAWSGLAWANPDQVRKTFGGCKRSAKRPGGKLARILLIDGEPNLRNTFMAVMAAYEHGQDIIINNLTEYLQVPGAPRASVRRLWTGFHTSKVFLS